MKAFVVTGPQIFELQEVASPVAGTGEVVVEVNRVGVCGTDVEFFNGTMPYLHDGQAKYPMRIGHEWTGRVIQVGEGVDSKLIDRRFIGDVMLGCGTCKRCQSGRQHTCATRFEVGIRNGWSGALAEQLVVPARFLHEIPDSFDDTIGALVEPGANAWRVADAAQAQPGKNILIWGTGTIGLLTAQFCLAMGANVHMVGKDPVTIKLALEIGVASAGESVIEIAGGYDAVIDATFDNKVPSKLVDLVEPGGRVVLIGVDNNPALLDSRTLVFKDLTVLGILSGSPGLAHSIEFIKSGRIDPRIIVGATVGLGEVGKVFLGTRPVGAGPGPKIRVDPKKF
jgi:2-desacetyl-2-hydroxyethyl bacteriochlorophyllide A dehydrogenase